MSLNKAVILVGGMGTRLRPITSCLPKPLVPIVGKPIIKRILKSASDFGITNAALATMFMPEKLKEALGQSCFGVQLSYVNEETPIGTAGGAKAAYCAIAENSNESIIILSGDGMWDFDIKAAIDFHESINADVTIVTTTTPIPTEYGIVNTAPDGKILRFAEKPTWSQVVSDKVNTGIYIMKARVFDFVPDGKSFDFSKDLFPLLLEKGNALFAFHAEGFWCDIGDAGSYYRCNMEALSGKIAGFDFSGALGGEEIFRLGATYSSPVWVSRLCNVEAGAQVGRFSVVGQSSKLCEGAFVEESVVHENVFVGKNAKISGSIVCNGARIGEGTVVKSGCVVGADCVVGNGATLVEGTVLAVGTRIGDGETVRKNAAFGTNFPFEMCEEGYVCKDSALMPCIGQTLAFATEKCFGTQSNKAGANDEFAPCVRIGVLRQDKAEAALAAESLLCGIRMSGARSFYFGTGFEAQAHFAAEFFFCDAFVWVMHEEDEIRFKVFDRLGRAVGKDFENAMKRFYDSENRTKPERIFDTEHFGGISFLYYNELLRMIQRDFTADSMKKTRFLSGMELCVKGGVEVDSPKYHFTKAVTELGAKVTEICGEKHLCNNKTDQKECECSGEKICITLEDDGLGVFFEQNGKCFDMPHVVAMLIATADKVSRAKGEVVIPIPFLSPRAFRRVASEVVTLREYLSEEAGSDLGVTREAVRNSLWVNDAVFAAVRLVCTVAKLWSKGGLDEGSAEIPGFCLYVGTLDEAELGGEVRARVMSHLAEMSGFSHGLSREREGIELVFDNGNVTVVPKKTGGFRLIGEALSMEAASELCNNVSGKICDIAKKDMRYPE